MADKGYDPDSKKRGGRPKKKRSVPPRDNEGPANGGPVDGETTVGYRADGDPDRPIRKEEATEARIGKYTSRSQRHLIFWALATAVLLLFGSGIGISYIQFQNRKQSMEAGEDAEVFLGKVMASPLLVRDGGLPGQLDAMKVERVGAGEIADFVGSTGSFRVELVDLGLYLEKIELVRDQKTALEWGDIDEGRERSVEHDVTVWYPGGEVHPARLRVTVWGVEG